MQTNNSSTPHFETVSSSVQFLPSTQTIIKFKKFIEIIQENDHSQAHFNIIDLY